MHHSSELLTLVVAAVAVVVVAIPNQVLIYLLPFHLLVLHEIHALE